MPKAVKGSCTSGKCGFRVAILAKNAEFQNLPAAPVKLDESARYIFFPGCENIDDAFLFMKGDENEINAALSLLDYSPTGFDDVKIFYNIEELDLNTLDNTGLKSGETTQGYSKPTKNGAECADPAGYAAGTTCTGTCKYTTVVPTSNGTVQVAGHVYALDSNKTPVVFNPTTDLEAKFFVDGVEQTSSSPVITQADGKVVLNAPVSALKDYTGQLHLRDTAGKYLPNIIDVSIPKSPGPTVSFGNVVMITRSGQGCQGLTGTALTDCLDAPSKKGDIKVTVIDGTTDKPVSGATVKLHHQFTTSGPTLDTDRTNNDGVVVFDDQSFDYGKIDVEHSGYQLSPNKIYHDNDVTEKKIFIFPETDSPMTLLMKVTDENKESDILLDIETKTGKTCTVSPENKFCPFTEHKKDVNKGSTGYEYIDVQRMTESKYLFYAKQDDSTYGECTASSTATVHYGQKNETFKQFFATKKSVKGHYPTTSAQPFWAIYCFTGFGLKSVKHLNLVSAAKPTIAGSCDALYPAGSKYSLDTLVQQNAVASAQ